MKKFLSVILAMCAAAFVFTGCGNDNNSGNQNATSGQIKQKLVMATNAQFPPYEYKNGDKIVGIDVDIMQAIADDMGMELSIEDMDFDSIIPAVKSGKADVGAAGMTVTEDRKKNVDFTDTYATAQQVVIVKENSTITKPDDLKGKKIGVQQGTTGDIYAAEDFGEDNLQRFSSGFEAVQSLSQGKIDAVIIDNEPAKVFVQQVDGLKILEEKYADEEYAFAVKKGNTELLNKINASLNKLKDSGKFDEIIGNYIKAQ